MIVHVCRKEYFTAAHRLSNPSWDEQKNTEVFGPCANANWHGHNFEMEVTVKGKPQADTGFVIDMKLLGSIIKEHIIRKVDKKNLNTEVDFMKGKMTSCENLVLIFWQILEEKLREYAPHTSLHCIELKETEKNLVRYYGE